MHADRFLAYLENPTQLLHLSFAELEALELEFPYSRNLQLLLFTKAWLEKHPQADLLLQKVSLFSTCRRSLYQYVQSLSELMVPAGTTAGEEDFDILELKELHTLSPTLTDKEYPRQQTRHLLDTDVFNVKKRKSIPHIPDRAAIRQKLETLFNESFAEPLPTLPLSTPPPAQARLSPPLRKKTGTHTAPTQPRSAAAEPGEQAPSVGPLPKSNFPSWQSALSRSMVSERLLALHQQLFPPNESDSNSDQLQIPEIARQSVADNLELASETYADILTQQGEYEKAIAVYHRLILKFPEKTAFFAGKIELLKKYLT